jgi:methionyl-tRNA formyltransferase
MRIIVNGQQLFGKSVLEALLERGEDVVGVYCAPDKEGRPADPLKQFAEEKGLPIFQPKSFRKPEIWQQIRELKPDLGVMAYVTLFVPEEALNIPTHGTIQYHPSLLPDHKGPSSINWPVMFGKNKTGLSIFWPDNGLDTGPILLQKEVPIGPDDTLGSVYFDHLYPKGVAAMLEAIDMVKAGTAPKVPQDADAGSYEGWCKKEDAYIDWNKPVQEVYNLIRGTNPQPGAWTRYQGKTVQIFDSRKIDAAAVSAAPGQITDISDEGISVAAHGGQILVQRVRPEGDKKIAAGEFAAKSGLSKGARLG